MAPWSPRPAIDFEPVAPCTDHGCREAVPRCYDRERRPARAPARHGECGPLRAPASERGDEPTLPGSTADWGSRVSGDGRWECRAAFTALHGSASPGLDPRSSPSLRRGPTMHTMKSIDARIAERHLLTHLFYRAGLPDSSRARVPSTTPAVLRVRIDLGRGLKLLAARGEPRRGALANAWTNMARTTTPSSGFDSGEAFSASSARDPRRTPPPDDPGAHRHVPRAAERAPTVGGWPAPRA